MEAVNSNISSALVIGQKKLKEVVELVRGVDAFENFVVAQHEAVVANSTSLHTKADKMKQEIFDGLDQLLSTAQSDEVAAEEKAKEDIEGTVNTLLGDISNVLISLGKTEDTTE
jgi:NTP pyrophosphatase (non-canonical NTP hydrolase)